MARLVLSQLRAGDELGSFPGHVVPRERNLSSLYARTPKDIVADNGTPFTSKAIEGHGGLLARAGSRTWTDTSGRVRTDAPVASLLVRHLVDNNTRLLLPEMSPPPRPIVGQPGTGGGPSAGDVGMGLGGLLLIGGGLWAVFGGD